MKKFGDCLKNIRQERGMTLEEMAKLLGTTKQVLSKYENHQRTPKVTVANEYAQKLGISLNVLLGIEEKSPAEAEDRSETLNKIETILNGLSEKEQELWLRRLEAMIQAEKDTPLE